MQNYGLLIYNGGLRSPKYMELNQLYADTAKALGIELTLVANNELYSLLETNGPSISSSLFEKQPDFILFLDKDIRLAKQLENMGYRLFNSREVIENCDDKILTFQCLAGKGINMPKTMFSPMFFPGVGPKTIDPAFTDQIEQTFGYPLVIKEAFGSFGAQVYLIHNRKELVAKQMELLYTPHLYQEFISSSKGRDVRIYVVGDKVVASMYRYSETDFRANVSNGASMKPYEPNETFCKLAIKASQLLGADFTGVDLLFGPNDEPILCEVNSNAHIKNILDCTGINVAEHIFKYILEVTNHA